MPRKRGDEKTRRLVFFYSWVCFVVILDQLTKWFAVTHLTEGESLPVVSGFFHFTLVFNTGIAFGLLHRYETVLFYLISLSILVLLVVGVRLLGRDGLTRLGLVLILGGAVGNWIDRFSYGAVIDFLDFRIWPVFNVADSAITFGVGLYLILLFRQSREGSGNEKTGNVP